MKGSASEGSQTDNENLSRNNVSGHNGGNDDDDDGDNDDDDGEHDGRVNDDDDDDVDGKDEESSTFPEVKERVTEAERPNEAIVGICIAIGLLILILLVLICIFAVRRKRHLKR